MRNLKKSLALILAMVMVFGLCTIGAGAAFGDQEAIAEDYAPSVAIMSGMGILKGDDNDGDGVYDFRPNDSVTRAEAAKMIAYMILGEATAEKLPARDVLDVPASAWESKFVSYLYNAGIVAGMGDGTFNSKGEVTANQYAKMLLCACGYGQEGEYVGKGWDVNVFIDAVDTIFKGADVADFSAPATRQEAAYYTLKAMTEIDLVKYTEANGYVEGNSNFAESKYNYAETTGIVWTTADASEDGTYAVIDGEDYIADIGKDIIGHRVRVYYNEKADKNGAYTVYAIDDLSKEVSVDTTIKALAKAIGKDYSSEYTYWVNYEAEDFSTNEGIDWKKLAETKGSKNAYTETEDGNTKGIYIYDTDAKEIIGYKTASYEVAKITKLTSSNGTDTLGLTFFSSTPAKTLVNDEDGSEFAIFDGAAKGDIVKVSKNGDIYTVSKLDIVDDVTVERYSSVKGTINNTYTKAADNSGYYVKDLDGTTGDKVTMGAIYDLYTDESGNWVFAMQDAEAIKEYILVTAIYEDDDAYFVQGVNAEGNVHSYQVEEDNYLAVKDDYDDAMEFVTVLSASAGSFGGVGGLVVSVTEAGDDMYTLKKYTVDGKQAYLTSGALRCEWYAPGGYYNGNGNTPVATDFYTTYNSDASLATKAVGAYYLDNDTKYYMVYFDGSKPATTKVINTAAASIDQTAWPCIYTVSLDNAAASAYQIDVVYLIGKPQPKTSSSKFIYAAGASNEAVEDYWSDITDNDADYYYLSAFVEGEFKEIAVEVNENNHPEYFFETDRSGNYVALKEGFYNYQYDAGDDCYKLTRPSLYDYTNDFATGFLFSSDDLSLDTTFSRYSSSSGRTKYTYVGSYACLDSVPVQYVYRNSIYFDISKYSHIEGGVELNYAFADLPSTLGVSADKEDEVMFIDLCGSGIETYTDLVNYLDSNEEAEVKLSFATYSGTVYAGGKIFVVSAEVPED